MVKKRKQQAAAFVSELGEATLRNAARMLELDPHDLPADAQRARSWLADRFIRDGLLRLPGAG